MRGRLTRWSLAAVLVVAGASAVIHPSLDAAEQTVIALGKTGGFDVTIDWTSDPVFRAHMTGRIRWALRLEP